MISIELIDQVKLVGYVVANTSIHGIVKGFVYKVSSTTVHNRFTFTISLEGVMGDYSSNYFDMPDRLAIEVYKRFNKPMNVSNFKLGYVNGRKAPIRKPEPYSLNENPCCEIGIGNNDYIDALSYMVSNNPFRSVISKKTTKRSIPNEFGGISLPKGWAGYIRVGDYVECINGVSIRDKGNGWELGKVFKVSHIESFFDDSTNEWHYIFFDDTKKGNVYINGVYFKHLMPIRSKKLLEYIESNRDKALGGDKLKYEVYPLNPLPSYDDILDIELVKSIDKFTFEYHEGEPILNFKRKRIITDIKFEYYV